MTLQQIELAAVLAGVLALLLWGRLRHDLVAAGGLLLAVLLGLVPESRAFSGFSNPAVLIVAFVLIASRAFETSGALALIAGGLVRSERGVALHIAVLGGVAAALSAVINNVAALALLMPLDIEAARKAKRSPHLTLMPLAFATVLGGMITLVGTPPNIIASSFRERELGAPYLMFDFAPVGLAVTVAGMAFIAVVGWRLIPNGGRAAATTLREDEFIAELVVPEGAQAIGRLVAELEGDAEKADVLIVRLLRRGRAVRAHGRYAHIEAGDILTVQGSTDGLVEFMNALDLHPLKAEGDQAREQRRRAGLEDDEGDDLAIVEAVVRADARVAGRAAESFRLRSRFGVALLGIAHRGQTFRERVRARVIEPGDVLLLAGPRAAVHHVVGWLGALPIDEVSVEPAKAWRIAVAVGCFAVAIAVASLGWLSFSTAMAIAIGVYAVTGLVPLREFYEHVEWPVIVMLAFLLPLGEAFDTVGGTAVVADLLLRLAQGGSAVLALVLLMVATMVLSSLLNNVATMVIAGPLALTMAAKLAVNPDAFLMGAVVATSCSFLTPIGHKNNTLVMGPGGYAFGDFWRLGLALEVIVLLVGVPAILYVWPL